jgi:hypothetical protein
LGEFLKARLNDDEQGARYRNEDDAQFGQSELDPDHALRVVAAHRRIVDRYVDLRDRCEVAWSDYSDWLEGKPGAGNAPGVSSHDPAIRDELERVLRDLASAYAGHGDYRAEWAA